MRRNERGFTLIEILIALFLISIVTAAIYKTFRAQQKSYMIQEEVVEMQQNLRAGMEMITREIRMAGYDPTESGNFGFLKAEPSLISFTGDFNTPENGTVDSGETLQYQLSDFDNDGVVAELVRTSSNTGPVALNIEAIGFAYGYDNDADGYLDQDASGHIIWAIDTNNDGRLDTNLDTNSDGLINASDNPAGVALTTPVNINTIRAVRIWMLARTSREARKFKNTNTYIVGNQHITVNDGYRRRLISAIIKCRNMGL